MYSETYQNFLFRGGKLIKTDDFEGFWLIVQPATAKTEKDILFKEVTLITGFAISIKYKNMSIDTVIDDMREITISKAKARIALNLYDKGKEYIQQITSQEEKIEENDIDDEIIQRWILLGLKNIRKNEPINFKNEKFDVKGFCQILAITKKQYLYNASILLEDDYIRKHEYQQSSISKGEIYITRLGIKNIPTTKEKKSKYIQHDNEIVPIQNGQVAEEYKYDIAMSFAGEDREIADQLATQLKTKGVRIFYDRFEESTLWGKNLYEYLDYVYNDAARFCIILISKNYAKKNWTNHERKSAQARAFRENTEYILPIKIDDTQIPGIHETVGYISIKDYTIAEIVSLIQKKIMQ